MNNKTRSCFLCYIQHYSLMALVDSNRKTDVQVSASRTKRNISFCLLIDGSRNTIHSSSLFSISYSEGRSALEQSCESNKADSSLSRMNSPRFQSLPSIVCLPKRFYRKKPSRALVQRRSSCWSWWDRCHWSPTKSLDRWQPEHRCGTRSGGWCLI